MSADPAHARFATAGERYSPRTTPKSASPLVTRENTSRTLSHGSGSAPGKTEATARSL